VGILICSIVWRLLCCWLWLVPILQLWLRGSCMTRWMQSDIFLIFSNAMQYNAAETTNKYTVWCFIVFYVNDCFILLTVWLLYLSQARSIQELGRKKFEKLRIGFERSQMEQKSEQKARSNYLVKKQPKKPLVRTSLEPVGSDFCSGATLATIAEENSNFSFFFK